MKPIIDVPGIFGDIEFGKVTGDDSYIPDWLVHADSHLFPYVIIVLSEPGRRKDPKQYIIVGQKNIPAGFFYGFGCNGRKEDLTWRSRKNHFAVCESIRDLIRHAVKLLNKKKSKYKIRCSWFINSEIKQDFDVLCKLDPSQVNDYRFRHEQGT